MFGVNRMGMTRYQHKMDSPFFLQLNKEDQQYLLYSGDRKTIKCGTLIYQEGDQLDDLYIILSGSVRMLKNAHKDQSFILHLKPKFHVIGEEILFQSPRAMLTVEALEDCVLIKLSKKQIEETFLRNPNLRMQFMKLAAYNNQRTQAKFTDLMMYEKTGALCSVLIRLANSYGMIHDQGHIHIDLRLTHQEIAHIIGTSRETVNRMFTELKKQNLVTMDRNSLIIHNIDALKKELHCEKCSVAICTMS